MASVSISSVDRGRGWTLVVFAVGRRPVTSVQSEVDDCADVEDLATSAKERPSVPRDAGADRRVMVGVKADAISRRAAVLEGHPA